MGLRYDACAGVKFRRNCRRACLLHHLSQLAHNDVRTARPGNQDGSQKFLILCWIIAYARVFIETLMAIDGLQWLLRYRGSG